MATLISVAVTILVPILVALVLLILPKAPAEKSSERSTPLGHTARHEVVMCVEIPEMLGASARGHGVEERI